MHQSGSRGQYLGTVIANGPVCRDHLKLIICVPGFAASEPGQFIQLQCEDPVAPLDEYLWNDRDWPRVRGEEISRRQAFLRRPFSLGGRRDTAQGAELTIIHRVVGAGTAWMSRLTIGQNVTLIGPLGNSFQMPAADQTALLVSGGVGIPPMLYWANRLAGRRTVAFCGATTRDLLPLRLIAGPSSESPNLCIAEFADCGIPSLITTDDGSLGRRGLVTDALKNYLDSADNALPPVIYTCGPEAMMKAVADIALARNIPCQAAVERAMACGMGTCQSCVIRVKKPDPEKSPLAGSSWCYRLACTDGPIFAAADLLW